MIAEILVGCSLVMALLLWRCFIIMRCRHEWGLVYSSRGMAYEMCAACGKGRRKA